jgi:hypothetical protein
MGTSTTVNTATNTRAQRSFKTARTAGDSRRHDAGTKPNGASGNAAAKSDGTAVKRSGNTRSNTVADTTGG